MSVLSLRAPFCLIASPTMNNSYFSQTVIVVAEYNRHGALGFIVNRPKAVPLKSLVHPVGVDVPDNIPTWFGGPVGLDSGIVLANQKIAQLPPNIANLPSEALALSADDSAIVKLIAFAEQLALRLQQPAEAASLHAIQNLYAFRFIVGYAGWGPGQLDEEIKQGTWLEAPVSERLVYSTPWENMWKVAIAEFGFQQQFFAQSGQSLPI
jgi:putative transcriptional regulator